jgi:hypothetical protein
MALTIGSPAIQSIKRIGKERGDSKKAGQDDAATMRRLPFWCHDKSALAYQGQQLKSTSVQGNKTKLSCVSGSKDLNTAGIRSPTQRQTDNLVIQGSNSLHRPFSGLRYIHMMANTSSGETIKAKLAFEQFATNHFVKIEHYHADNGRFADNAFINHCSSRQQ